MAKVADIQTNKVEHSQRNTHKGNKAAARLSEGELMKQFSSLLDEIAQQLAAEQDFSAQQIEVSVKVKGEPVVRERFVVEGDTVRAEQPKAKDSEVVAEEEQVSQQQPQTEEGSTEAQDEQLAADGDAVVSEEKTAENVSPDQAALALHAGILQKSEPVAVEQPVQTAGSDVESQVVAEESEGEAAANQEPAMLAQQELAQAPKTLEARDSKKQIEVPNQKTAEAPKTEAQSQEVSEIQQLLERQAKVETPAVSESAKNTTADATRNATAALAREQVLQVIDRVQVDRSQFERITQAFAQGGKNAGENNHGNKLGLTGLNSQVQNLNATDSSFARSSAAARNEQADAARALPKALANRTLEKVESALKEVSKSRDGKTISVRLDPPELGSVKIDVSYRDGNLHARIVAESPQVNSLLREKAHELQNLLRKIGLDVERVSVSVSADQNNAAGQQGGNSQAHNSHQEKQFNDFFNGGFAAETTEAPAVKTAVTADDHWVA